MVWRYIKESIGKRIQPYLDKPHTPLVFETGLFHSRWRTLAFILIWTGQVIWIGCWNGEIYNVISDPWSYLFPSVLLIIYKATNIATDGLRELFDVFHSKSADKMDVYSDNIIKDPLGDKYLKDIFIEGTFDEVRDDVGRFLFRWMGLALGFTLWISWLVAGSYIMWGTGAFSEPIPLWMVVYMGTNTILFGVASFGVASVTWIVLTLIRSIKRLMQYKENLKISEYIRHIRNQEDTKTDQMMDYHQLYIKIVPLGQYLTTLAFFVLGIVVVSAVYWTLFFYIFNMDPLIFVWVMNAIALVFSIAFFIWPQLDMSSFLGERKSAFLSALTHARMEVDLFFISKCRELSAESIKSDSHMEATKSALEGWNLDIQYTENISIWSFRTSTVIQIVIAVFVPILVAILTNMMEMARVP